MPAGSNWRVRGGDYLGQLDRPGFAWEFLRRNPAYQEDFKRIAREAASDAGSKGHSRDALVWRWGLTFCGRSAAFRRSSDCLLARERTAHGSASRARVDAFRWRAPN
jgi:Proteobacterial transcriptional regulator-like domain